MPKILLSFVGTNDAGLLLGNNDGAILTTLTNEKFDEVILLWNEAKIKDLHFSQITLYLKREIKKRKLAKKITDYEFTLSDVTDHNEVYTKLKDFTDTLNKSTTNKYVAAISSGTPAMQVSWILLAESGDFSEDNHLSLIKTTDPKFGKSKNIPVKLSTSLPRIVTLTNEVRQLKEDLIPQAEINIRRGTLTIGRQSVKLSPMQFCYYRYFAERKINKKPEQKFSGITVPIDFIKTIYSYHQETFEELELNRQDIKSMIDKKEELAIQTFRGNITKLNKRIEKTLNNLTLYDQFSVSSSGTRGAKFLGIKAPAEKMELINE
jgi:effector-binding domain-containing protein